MKPQSDEITQEEDEEQILKVKNWLLVFLILKIL